MLTPPITPFRINSLTTDITPAAGVPGVKLLSQADNRANGGAGVEFVPGGNGRPGSPGQFLFTGFLGGSSAIRTSGPDACGISAQSVAGRGGNGGSAGGGGCARGGNGGPDGSVLVWSAGIIQTLGADSHGLFGQSIGVRMDGPGIHQVLNVGHVAALSCTAIVGEAGHDQVVNSGTVTGAVELGGGGGNLFINTAGATFNAGAHVDLGGAPSPRRWGRHNDIEPLFVEYGRAHLRRQGAENWESALSDEADPRPIFLWLEVVRGVYGKG